MNPKALAEASKAVRELATSPFARVVPMSAAEWQTLKSHHRQGHGHGGRRHSVSVLTAVDQIAQRWHRASSNQLEV